MEFIGGCLELSEGESNCKTGEHLIFIVSMKHNKLIGPIERPFTKSLLDLLDVIHDRATHRFQRRHFGHSYCKSSNAISNPSIPTFCFFKGPKPADQRRNVGHICRTPERPPARIGKPLLLGDQDVLRNIFLY